jgi:hypothetical protein
LDAQSARDDSAGSSDTQSLVLGSIFYTKPPGVTQGGNQKNYWRMAKTFEISGPTATTHGKRRVFLREVGSHPDTMAWRTSASIVLTETLGRCGSCGAPTPVVFLGKGYSKMSSRWRASSVFTEIRKPIQPSSLLHIGSLTSCHLRLLPSTTIKPSIVRLRLFFCPCIT